MSHVITKSRWVAQIFKVIRPKVKFGGVTSYIHEILRLDPEPDLNGRSKLFMVHLRQIHARLSLLNRTVMVKKVELEA